jgi:hypothetical protein
MYFTFTYVVPQEASSRAADTAIEIFGLPTARASENYAQLPHMWLVTRAAHGRFLPAFGR